MMNEYEFQERSSTTIVEGDERFRRINFRGVDPERELNVDGHIPKVPESEYFEAGMEGKMNELIKDFVVKKLTNDADE